MVQDVRPREVWQRLREDPAAQLIDVRTDAEWSYVGFPDLAELGKQIVGISWQVFPAMQVNESFVAHLRGAGLAETQPLFFLCRSGVRSLHAARAAMAAGWQTCFNIADGFEGPHDEDGHRGTIAGWKAEGLPWRQR
jgi:rhodanese-related sulfurtransferase